MQPRIERIDVSTEELEGLLEQARPMLSEDGYQKLRAAIRTLGYVTGLLEKQETTLASLRELLCHASTEKTEAVLKQAGIETGDKNRKAPKEHAGRSAGHGRNGAAAYRGAQKVQVPHESLKAGDPCPDAECGGKVYAQRDPGVRVRVKGQAPIAATVYELEKLRCHLCGKVFTAAAPEGAGEKKYDESAAAMMAVLRYGSGFPWNRLEGLEENLGIPLPAATQCQIMAETAVPLQPALEELMRQAARGEVAHNDDTSMRVLSLDRDADLSPDRTGVFTSGIVWVAGERRMALFFTGCKHAGENLAEVLKQRPPGLSPPIQMCDALSRNVPKLNATMVANCNAHSRRNFVKVTASFPVECRFVLETLGEVFGYDEQAREQGLSPDERLHFHQEHSRPLMEKLHSWSNAQFEERKSRTELRSGSGDLLPAEALGKTHAVPASGGNPDRQQSGRARPEKSHSSSKELAVLQDPEWSTDGGSVHEPDSHLRVERRQSIRLSDRVTAPCRRVEESPLGMDALDLPRYPGTIRYARGRVI